MDYNFDYQIYRLSPLFYNDYPTSQYPEILLKSARSYNCILIDIHAEYFICLPFRSYLNHKFGYHFTTTQRSKRCHSGLDYTKMVIIQNLDYLDNGAVVDQDEYKEMVQNIDKIVLESMQYLNSYIDHKKGIAPLHERRYQREYSKSTLPYFDSLLL